METMKDTKSNIKEVKTSSMGGLKRVDFYLSIIDSIKKGYKLPNLPISKQNMNYYISKLKKEGIIKRIGYGTWELTGDYTPKQVKKKVKITSTHTKKLFTFSDDDTRGHAFIFRFKLPHQILK